MASSGPRPGRTRRLAAYGPLSRLLFPRGHLGKILLLAFVGTHLPLAVLLAYLLLVSGLDPADALKVLGVALAATLLGSALTLSGLWALLSPVTAASRALRAYRAGGVLPDLTGGLPEGTLAEDEAARLLADVEGTVSELDGALRRLRDLADRDPLTGLLNRRACEERLREDLARAGRSGDAIALATVDADGLKEINDSFGHAAGDAALGHLAGAIGRNLRAGDWAARWGGDEFVVAMREAEGDDAASEVLGRVDGELREAPAELPGGRLAHLSASAGVARGAGGGGAPDGDPRELLARADRALYRAKDARRPGPGLTVAEARDGGAG